MADAPAATARRLSTTHRLLAMLMGNMQTQLIRVAAQLGLADLLKDGPKGVEELAEATAANLSALRRVMRALVDLGLVVETETRQFRSTPLGALLETDAPNSLRAYAILAGAEWLTRPSAHLLRAVQTGTNAFENLFGMSLYEYVPQHPDAAALFNEALTSVSKQEAIAFRDAYDFSAVSTVVDVGGGRGFLLSTLLESYPSLRGILLDLPTVIAGAGADAVLQPHVSTGRCEIIGGDFHRSVPSGGDVYILKRILPAFDDAQATIILRNCRDAMGPGGRVLVVDPDTSSLYGSLFDISMLVLFGGRLRTQDDLRGLFVKSGLALTRAVTTQSTLWLVEGCPS
jgi:hypothetical protein